MQELLVNERVKEHHEDFPSRLIYRILSVNKSWIVYERQKAQVVSKLRVRNPARGREDLTQRQSVCLYLK